MKKIIALSLIFALLGGCILLGSACFCLRSLNNTAIMVQTPTAALECSENLMNAIQNGDYAAASGYLHGQVDLGVNREPEEDAAKLLWNAFEDSISYEFVGECFPTTTGVARTVRITTLNPAIVKEQLPQRLDELLDALVEAGKTDIYDDEGNFREDLTHSLLQDALEGILASDTASITHDVQLNLVYQNGQWWVVADAALLQAISGGVAG